MLHAQHALPRALPRSLSLGAAALGAGLLTATPAMGQSAAPFLQWFEISWVNMERRMPDLFVAGYGGVWVPPISRASDSSSPGFDVFDRFDLGSPLNPTIYGTEQSFRAVVDEFHRANVLVYVDSIMNHNSSRNGSAGFIADGGYPGFWMNPPGPKTTGSGDWGDFHNGFFQSHDPGGGAGPYNLFEGDLVSLIDINQASNHFFIRHPVEPGNPQNLPQGNFRNIPDAENARFYPDLSLTPKVVVNPGTSRNPAPPGGFPPFTIHPFNTASPMSGDAVTENATGLLLRWTQWMLDDLKVDGFRLDASKHIPSWFWDNLWDAYVYERRIAPSGAVVTPYSFGENVEGNTFVYQNYVRKDGFGNRDALDLNGAGRVRDVIAGKGADNISSLLGAHLDNADDGLNNGSVGVNHAVSHDNGTRDGLNSEPDFPYEDKIGFWAHAYLLMRTGPVIVYDNAGEMKDRFTVRGFWPDEGVTPALGYGSYYTVPSNTLYTGPDDRMVVLTNLRNRYARGEFTPRWQDGDVLIFERRTNLGGGNYTGNVLVGVNDQYNNSVTTFDTRTVSTSFPAGTRLRELTGNHANPLVDPSNVIDEVVTVGAGGSVTIRVPRNKGTSVEHNRGYVIYGPATPSGTLNISGTSVTLPPDSAFTPIYSRRLTPVHVVEGSTFQIQLTTSKTDPSDPNWDDYAIFRMNQGFDDLNGNGVVDETSGEFAGFEQFLTINQPLFGTANANGFYAQTINTDLLPEGYNYLSVIAFRHRASGDPLYNDFRTVIYVDRQLPQVEIEPPVLECGDDAGTVLIRSLDRTVTRVHCFVNLAEGAPIPTLNLTNQALAYDRREWLFGAGSLQAGENSITVVAIEEPSPGFVVAQSVTRFTFNVGGLLGDLDLSGVIDIEDLHLFDSLVGYLCEADMDQSGAVNDADRQALRALIRAGEPADVVID